MQKNTAQIRVHKRRPISSVLVFHFILGSEAIGRFILQVFCYTASILYFVVTEGVFNNVEKLTGLVLL